MSDMNDLARLLKGAGIGGGVPVPRMYVPSAHDLKMPAVKNIWQVQSELFMEGLKSQVEELESSLQTNQELVMICWHGHEKFQVLSISMPSENVVALNCRDSDGDVTQVTGHMNSVTFSFRVITAKEPVQRRPIGFEMPSANR